MEVDRMSVDGGSTTPLVATQHQQPLVKSAPQNPMYKLSVDLLKTYKQINQIYYNTKKKAEQTTGKDSNDGYDDDNADFIIKINDVLYDRYVISSILGKGSFGQVVKCFDKVDNQFVAIKIIKNKNPFYNQALIEIKLLELIKRKDEYDRYFIVRLYNSFEYKNHLCLVFELLSYNLYDVIRNTHFQGVSLNLIRKFGYQILRALYFLQSSDVDIVHCDLKPENILLKNPKRSAIKIIDFGSSCHSKEKMYKYIQSRFYRSPEVLLELEYNHSIDIWSLGCILLELHTGEPLFPGSNEYDQMMKIISLLGLPPVHMIESSSKAKKFFNKKYDDVTHKFIYEVKEPKKVVPRDLSTILGVSSGGPGGRRIGESGHSYYDYLKFKDLIYNMLLYDPHKRISIVNALQHSFFVQSSNEDFKMDTQPTTTPITSTNIPSTTPAATALKEPKSEIGIQVDL